MKKTVKKWISSQAKHFDKNVKYDDIKDSCEKATRYYAGKLDIIYLYCNLNINEDRSIVYQNTINILQENGISVELVVNDAILDIFRSKKYSDLALYYFGILQLSEEWFANKARVALENLDERFKRFFNVDTEISEKLSLFFKDNYAVVGINNRKHNLLN